MTTVVAVRHTVDAISRAGVTREPRIEFYELVERVTYVAATVATPRRSSTGPSRST